MIIKKVKARSIADSRGEKTIEVSVNGSTASSPSGKSTGIYESKPYYKSLDFCVRFLNDWNTELNIGAFNDLALVEKEICKKLKLKKAELFGGNALFAFESAILKALAQEKKQALWQVINPHARTMPVPVGNAVGGGLHSAQFKVHPVFQEFLIIPREETAVENVAMMKDIYTQLGRRFNATKTNDEGAWHVAEDDEAILKALADYSSSIHIGVDVAASSFYQKPLYNYNKISRTPSLQIHHVIDLARTYGIFYIEDPVEQEDFQGCAQVNKSVTNALVVGDDLTATHLERVKNARAKKAINAMIIKPNQNGSLIQVKEIVEHCKKHSIVMIFSHRSGETMDNALADYAVGFGAQYMKAGIATPWREAKLKRLIEIENSFK